MKLKDWKKAISWELISFFITLSVTLMYFKSFSVTYFVVLLTLIKIPLFAFHNSMWRLK